MASTKRNPKPIVIARGSQGNFPFGFGWWYYARTEGATALA
jgi:hypothetical protein